LNNRSGSFFKLLILLVVTIAIGSLSYFGIGASKTFSASEIRQGLDLQGGVSILYEAGLETPSVEDMNSASSVIRKRLDSKGYNEYEE
jgi:preprotein translocase subunit SecD